MTCLVSVATRDWCPGHQCTAGLLHICHLPSVQVCLVWLPFPSVSHSHSALLSSETTDGETFDMVLELIAGVLAAGPCFRPLPSFIYCVLSHCSDLGRTVFKLFQVGYFGQTSMHHCITPSHISTLTHAHQHPSLAIVKAAGLIMKAIIEVCSARDLIFLPSLIIGECPAPCRRVQRRRLPRCRSCLWPREPCPGTSTPHSSHPARTIDY